MKSSVNVHHKMLSEGTFGHGCDGGCVPVRDVPVLIHGIVVVEPPSRSRAKVDVSELPFAMKQRKVEVENAMLVLERKEDFGRG